MIVTAINVPELLSFFIILIIKLFISYFDTTNIQPFLLLCKYNCTFNIDLTFFNCIASKTINWIKPNKTSFILFFGCWCVFQEIIIKNQKINHFKNYIYAHVLYIYILFYFIFDLISYILLTYRKLRG